MRAVPRTTLSKILGILMQWAENGDFFRWARAPALPDPIDHDALAASVRDALSALPHPIAHLGLVLPDRTRDVAEASILPLVAATLDAGGKMPARITAFFAGGTHRPMAQDEMAEKTRFFGQPVRWVAHDAQSKNTVEGLNEGLWDCDGLLVISAMNLHYLAGFGGGRKMIAPGLSDERLATRIHRHCMAPDGSGRHALCRPGVLEKNPIHLAILPLLEKLPPTSGICLWLEDGKVVDAEGGHLVEHHLRLARRFAKGVRAPMGSQRFFGAVISCGSAPRGGDLVQAHKALVAAEHLLLPRAPIFFSAPLDQGLGPRTFVEALARKDADELFEALQKEFRIGLQTAWSLRSIIQRHPVHLFSSRPDAEIRALGFVPAPSQDALFRRAEALKAPVAILPQGAARLYEMRQDEGGALSA
jgi:nickel-dependent lactate racemase